MKLLNPEFKHEDPRRSLQQLLTEEIAQINFYDAKKGSVLGNHYHKVTKEYFYITRGVVIAHVGKSSVIMNRGSLFLVEPGEFHSIECNSDAQMMTFLTKAYSKEDTDTYV